MRLVAIASLALALGIGTVSAEEMKPPRVSSVAVDWGRLSGDFQILDEGRPTGATGDQANDAPAAAAEAIARINLATGERFANIAASPVPVLLPFDTPAFMRDREGIVDAPRADAPNYLANYLLGFDSVPFFYAGPGGYDAVVLARPQEMRDLGIGFSRPIYIHISGSALLYELDEPARLIEWPSPKLDDFPGLRRVYLENYARYIFVRYGMPYVLAIECFDGGSRFGKISCRDADKVAIRALKALHFAGGTPQQQVEERGADTIDRPASHSTVFTYLCSGKHHSGHRLSAHGRRSRLYGLFQHPLSNGGRPGIRQVATVHQPGQLRGHRSLRHGKARGGKTRCSGGISLPRTDAGKG